LLIGPRGLGQRHRGQTDAGSWVADPLSRFRALVVLAVLLISALLPDAASAGSRRMAPDPSPQKAPRSASAAAPTPDPPPQTALRSQSPHVTPSSPTLVAVTPRVNPRSERVTPPAQHSVTTSDAAGVQASTARHTGSRRQHPRAAPRGRTHARHAAPSRSTRVSLSLPLAFLTRDLLRLAPGALRSGAASPSDGGLLLLSALAMAILAVASFVLLRRTKQPGGPAR
jgi:hypothetical protein